MWIFITFTFLLTWLYIRSVWGKKRLNLDGPRGLPWIGNVIQLGTAPHLQVAKWAEIYGGLYKLKLFGREELAVCGEEAMKEVLITKAEDFSKRPYVFAARYLGDDGIAMRSPNPRWQILKNSVVKSLNLMGDGVKRLEVILAQMMDDLIVQLEQTDGKPFNPKPVIHQQVCNINALLVFGHRLNAEQQKHILQYDQEAFKVLGASYDALTVNTFQWLKHVPNPFMKKLNRVCKIKETVLGQAIRKSLKEYNCDDKHVMATVLQNKQSTVTEPGKEITMETLASISTDLMLGGSISSTMLILGMLANLASDSKLQSRCQEEVRKAIGSRLPTLDDRTALPFVESMVLELIRYITVIPHSIPHVATKDTSVLGTAVPEGTNVWVNFWHVQHDEKLWKDPWKFIPDRFLDETGNLVPPEHQLRKRIYQFGAGRRACPGAYLAKARLFMFITTLLQSFTFLPGDEGSSLPADPRTWQPGAALRPNDFLIRAIPRNI